MATVCPIRHGHIEKLQQSGVRTDLHFFDYACGLDEVEDQGLVDGRQLLSSISLIAVFKISAAKSEEGYIRQTVTVKYHLKLLTGDTLADYNKVTELDTSLEGFTTEPNVNPLSLAVWLILPINPRWTVTAVGFTRANLPFRNSDPRKGGKSQQLRVRESLIRTRTKYISLISALARREGCRIKASPSPSFARRVEQADIAPF